MQIFSIVYPFIGINAVLVLFLSFLGVCILKTILISVAGMLAVVGNHNNTTIGEDHRKDALAAYKRLFDEFGELEQVPLYQALQCVANMNVFPMVISSITSKKSIGILHTVFENMICKNMKKYLTYTRFYSDRQKVIDGAMEDDYLFSQNQIENMLVKKFSGDTLDTLVMAEVIWGDYSDAAYAHPESYESKAKFEKAKFANMLRLPLEIEAEIQYQLHA